MKSRSLGAWLWSAISMAAVLLVVATSGCGGGGGGGGVPAGGGGGPLPGNTAALPSPTTVSLNRTQNLPGMNVVITGVSGASGANGAFQVGDYPSVTFTIKNDQGADLPIFELNSASIYLSGPTNNYQPVLDRKTDLRTFSVDNGDGSYTYNWQLPIPDTYRPGFNDTTAIGAVDNDWVGLPLVDGTYTFGIEMYKSYDIDGDSIRDPAFASMDVLLGNATTLEHREVVTTENCNSCHVELRFHGGFRREVLQCLLCHTNGAEDANNPSILGGTPGVTIAFGPLIHRIHSGGNLPSNLGIGTNANGSRDYTKTPVMNAIVRGTRIYDYSEIVFPVWPSLANPMPRDAGFSSLGSTEQGLENAQRQGVVACHKCHGDPDGSGPLPAPAQGDNCYSKPSRMLCGSCHDDWDFSLPYSANQTTMPPQANNDSCLFCHPADGPAALPTRDLHVHPMVDDTVSPDFHFVVTGITEAGTNNGSGTFEAGEKMQVSFQIKEIASGADVPAANLNRVEFSIAGPVANRNLLHTQQIPVAALGAGPTYTMNVPFDYQTQFLGDSTGANGDVFMTTQGSILGGTTPTVFARTATGAGSTLSNPAAAFQNYVDVVDGSLFARNGYIVIDDGGAGEEYLRLQYVDGNRLWFTSPYTGGYKIETEFAHAAGETVFPVTLTQKTAGTDYMLDAVNGTFTELIEFGAGAAVVANYTSDWIVPMSYPVPLNGSPDYDETWGKWQGKSLVPGTYTFGIWGRQAFSVTAYGETTSYQSPTKATNTSFQVGVGSPVSSYDLISGEANCNRCHDDIFFHGNGRRGFDACIMCHGTNAAEDRPQYVAANAGATTRTSVEFREMLHKIHMGAELDDAANYVVNGFGNGYPNNFTEHRYDEVHFPAFNGEAKQCTACHGTSDSWESPGNRSHPTEQMTASLDWTASCGSCHNSPAAGAHMTLQMSGGVEACSVCHGTGRGEAVELIHKEF